ncbi:hypothetical protein BDZ97DRAFT_1930779 [Flammula alnicola]|nr:hypothetical protein BDZ97DRAFT_1930779 [Flammula alnicola]
MSYNGSSRKSYNGSSRRSYNGSSRTSNNGLYVHDLTLRGEATAGPSTTSGSSRWLNPDIMDPMPAPITGKRALDDMFDYSTLFRPDGDLDFERDFGQWFNPDDQSTPYGE